MFKDKKFEGLEPRFIEEVDLSEVYFTRFRPGAEW